MNELKLRMSRKAMNDLRRATPIVGFQILPSPTCFHHEVLQGLKQFVRSVRTNRRSLFLLSLRPLAACKFFGGLLVKLFQTLPEIRQNLSLQGSTHRCFSHGL